jgi:CNT family concentrative nucleoside transporter
MIAKILLPETQEPSTRGTVKMEVEKATTNVIDAAANGAGDGLKLALNVGAMPPAFIALLNAPIEWLGMHAWSSNPTNTLNHWLSQTSGRSIQPNMQTIFGWVLTPVAWLIGAPWQNAPLIGGFIGEKVVINRARLCLRAVLTGWLATFLTATISGAIGQT